MRHTVLISSGVLFLILVSCTPPPNSWAAEVHGVEIYYQVKDIDPILGYATPLPGWCEVQIDDELQFPTAIAVVAHEVGHCLDFGILFGTHNGFGDKEAYANAYAEAYINKCDFNGYALGWNDEGEPCTPPLPRSVTPLKHT